MFNSTKYELPKLIALHLPKIQTLVIRFVPKSKLETQLASGGSGHLLVHSFTKTVGSAAHGPGELWCRLAFPSIGHLC